MAKKSAESPTNLCCPFLTLALACDTRAKLPPNATDGSCLGDKCALFNTSKGKCGLIKVASR